MSRRRRLNLQLNLNSTFLAATGKGEISERMKIPGNTWQTVWAAARAIPAMKQVG